MFFYNNEALNTIGTVSTTVLETKVFKTKNIAVSLRSDGTISNTLNSKIITIPNFSNNFSFALNEYDNKLFLAFQSKRELSEFTVITSDFIYEITTLDVIEKFKISEVIQYPKTTLCYNHFLKAKVIPNTIGFSFLDFSFEISDFKNFSNGSFPVVNGFSGLESYKFYNYSLTSRFVKLNDFTSVLSKAALDFLLGRSEFNNSNETFVRYDDFLTNFYFSNTDELYINYLITSSIAKVDSLGIVKGFYTYKTYNCATVLKLDDSFKLSFSVPINLFGVIDSKNITDNSIFENFDNNSFLNRTSFYVKKSGEVINSVIHFINKKNLKKLVFEFNKKSFNVLTKEAAFVEYNYDFFKKYSFPKTIELSTYLNNVQSPSSMTDSFLKEETNQNSLSNTSVFSKSAPFKSSSYSVNNLKSLFAVEFGVFKNTVGTSKDIFNFNFKSLGAADFNNKNNTLDTFSIANFGLKSLNNLNFNTENCFLNFNFDLVPTDSITFATNTPIYLRRLIGSFYRFYDLTSNTGFVYNENISFTSTIPFSFEQSTFRVLKLKEKNILTSFFCLTFNDSKSILLTPIDNLISGTIFKIKNDFGLSVSNSAFSSEQAITITDFLYNNNNCFLTFKRSSLNYFSVLDEFEFKNSSGSTFAKPTGISKANRCVYVTFDRTDNYPLFPITSNLTSNFSDFPIVAIDNTITIEGDVPGYFKTSSLVNLHSWSKKSIFPLVYNLETTDAIKAGNSYLLNFVHKCPGLTKTISKIDFLDDLNPIAELTSAQETYCSVKINIVNDTRNQNAYFSLFCFKSNGEGDYSKINELSYTYDSAVFGINDDITRKNISENDITISLIGLTPKSSYRFFVVPTSIAIKACQTIVPKNITNITDLLAYGFYTELDFETADVPCLSIASHKHVGKNLEIQVNPYVSDSFLALSYTYFKREKIFVNNKFTSITSDFNINKNLNDKSLLDYTAYTPVPINGTIVLNNINENEDVFLFFNYINKTQNNFLLFKKNTAADFYFSGTINPLNDIINENEPVIKKFGLGFFFENKSKFDFFSFVAPQTDKKISFSFLDLAVPQITNETYITIGETTSKPSFDVGYIDHYEFRFLNKTTNVFNRIDTTDLEFRVPNLNPNSIYSAKLFPVFKNEITASDFETFVKYELENNPQYLFETYKCKAFKNIDFSVSNNTAVGFEVNLPSLTALNSLYLNLEPDVLKKNLKYSINLFDQNKTYLKSYSCDVTTNNLFVNGLDNATNYFVTITAVGIDGIYFPITYLTDEFLSVATACASNSDYEYFLKSCVHDGTKMNFVLYSQNSIKDLFLNGQKIVFTVDTNSKEYSFSKIGTLLSFSENEIIISYTVNVGSFVSEVNYFTVLLPKFFDVSYLNINKTEYSIAINSLNDDFDRYYEFSINNEVCYKSSVTSFKTPVVFGTLKPNTSYSLIAKSKSFLTATNNYKVFNPLVAFTVGALKTQDFALLNSVLKTNSTNLNLTCDFIGVTSYLKIEQFDSDRLVTATVIKTLTGSIDYKEFVFDLGAKGTTVGANLKLYNEVGCTTLKKDFGMVFLDIKTVGAQLYKQYQSKDSFSNLLNNYCFEFIATAKLSNLTISSENNLNLIYKKTSDFIRGNVYYNVYEVVLKDLVPNIKYQGLALNFETTDSEVASSRIELPDFSILEAYNSKPEFTINNNEIIFDTIEIGILNSEGSSVYDCYLFYKETSGDSFNDYFIESKTIYDSVYTPELSTPLKKGYYCLKAIPKNSMELPLDYTAGNVGSVNFEFKDSFISLPEFKYFKNTSENALFLNFIPFKASETSTDYFYITNNKNCLSDSKFEDWKIFESKNKNTIVLPFILTDGLNEFYIKGYNNKNKVFTKINSINTYYSSESENKLFPSFINVTQFSGIGLDGTTQFFKDQSREFIIPSDFTFKSLYYKIISANGTVVSSDSVTKVYDSKRITELYLKIEYNGLVLKDGSYFVEFYFVNNDKLMFFKQTKLEISLNKLTTPKIRYTSQNII